MGYPSLMKCASFLFVVILAATSPLSLAQNLFLNPSFETIDSFTPPFPQDQDVRPDHWAAIYLSVDTYSVTGDFGLKPGDNIYGRWNQLVVPADGERFIAGGVDSESFGQALVLTPGQTYTVGAFIAADGLFQPSATWRVFLHDTSWSQPDLTLGVFAPVTAADTWEWRSFTFTAPANSSEYSMVGFVPDTGFGIYMGIDAVSLAVIPEPAAVSLGAGILIGLAVIGRRRVNRGRGGRP
jgi:hypothetical protein